MGRGGEAEEQGKGEEKGCQPFQIVSRSFSIIFDGIKESCHGQAASGFTIFSFCSVMCGRFVQAYMFPTILSGSPALSMVDCSTVLGTTQPNTGSYTAPFSLVDPAAGVSGCAGGAVGSGSSSSGV